MHTRSCLCGAVAWEAEGPLELMHHCHCTRCRKAHATAFATDAVAPEAGFRWTRGAELVARYASSPGLGRAFCGRCGAVLPGPTEGGRVVLPAGALEGEPGARPLAHIFAGSKAPWWTIADDLPQFEAWPPGFDGPVLPAPEPRPPEPGVLHGSCLCGAVRYRLEGPPRALRLCHCSRCRRARGALFAANLLVAPGALRVTGGSERMRSFALPGARRFRHVFCEVCGASLPRAEAERDVAVVPLGTLDDDPGVRPECHVFVGSAAPWYAIPDDGLPRFEGAAPARTEALSRAGASRPPSR